MNHKPPVHLDPTAQAKWLEVLPILEARGDTIDAGTLDGIEAYATAYGQWRAAQAQVDAIGPVIKSAAGFAIVSPYVTVAAAAERRLRQWSAELGLSPAAKKKLRAAKKTTDQPSKNPLSQLRVAR